jgi:hypothetical protein
MNLTLNTLKFLHCLQCIAKVIWTLVMITRAYCMCGMAYLYFSLELSEFRIYKETMCVFRQRLVHISSPGPDGINKCVDHRT